MKTVALFIFVGAVSAAHGQASGNGRGFPEKSLSDLTTRLLSSGGDGDNVIFSPSSIFVGIGMLYTGMDGNTKAAVREAMNFPANDEEFADAMTLFTQTGKNGTKFVANMITVSQSAEIKPEFAKGIQEVFHGSPYYQDFTKDPERVRKSVNVWVSRRTNKQIKQLMPPGSVRPDTSVVLVNALYFKSDWEKQFDRDTFLGNFNTGSGRVAGDVEMMAGNQYVGYENAGDYEIVAMPFTDSDYKMVFVLPREGSDPQALIGSSLSSDLMDSIMRPSEKLQQIDAFITMPRFKSSMGSELTTLLKTMPGLDQVFSPTADLSKISQTPVRIGNVNHKAVVDVSQSGVEAAAATSISIVLFANFQPEITVTMDRPFMYFIVEEPIGAIHIAGVLNDPRGA